MPLRAKLNGTDIIASLIDDTAWEKIKEDISLDKNSLLLPCCGKSAYLRKSVFGTKHFVHRKSSCKLYSYSDNNESLKIKTDIVLACDSCGYKVLTEVITPEWSADVLAEKGKVKIAFHVTQKYFEKALELQGIYEKNNIRGCWFFKDKISDRVVPREDLPIFYFSLDKNKNTQVLFNDEQIPIKNFVKILLSGQIKFSNKLISKPYQEITIIFFEITCFKCSKQSHAYYVDKPLYNTSTCGIKMSRKQNKFIPYTFNPSRLIEKEFESEIISSVQKYLETEKDKNLKVKIKNINRISEEKDYKFGCYWCDNIFAKSFLERESIPVKAKFAMQKEYILGNLHNPIVNESLTIISAILKSKVKLNEAIIIEQPHWCYSESKEFCDDISSKEEEAISKRLLKESVSPDDLFYDCQ